MIEVLDSRSFSVPGQIQHSAIQLLLYCYTGKPGKSEAQHTAHEEHRRPGQSRAPVWPSGPLEKQTPHNQTNPHAQICWSVFTGHGSTGKGRGWGRSTPSSHQAVGTSSSPLPLCAITVLFGALPLLLSHDCLCVWLVRLLWRFFWGIAIR